LIQDVYIIETLRTPRETQSKRKNKGGLPEYLWVLQRALEGRSGRTERSKGAQGRIMHQRPENRGALNKPTSTWGQSNLEYRNYP